MQSPGNDKESNVMRQGIGRVREEGSQEESQPRTLSMRGRIVVLAVLYFCCVGLILSASSRGVVRAYSDIAWAALFPRSAESAQSAAAVGNTGGPLIITMEVRQLSNESCPVSASILHLFTYGSGVLTEVWSTSVEGWVWALTLVDVTDDAKPEIVVATKPFYYCDGRVLGSNSLLIYENVSGGYRLAFKRIGEIGVARARMMDYYSEGREFLLTVFDRRLSLVGRTSKGHFVLNKLEYEVETRYGLDAGDVTDDGLEDIVYGCKGGGFMVLENQGRGRYREQSIKAKIHPKEIRIGDVDGDGTNEIVTVGGVWDGRGPCLCVWERLSGAYKSIWTYRGEGISSVDIGDIDGDGVNEIVAGSEGGRGETIRGTSIWKRDESLGSFRKVWEDKGNETVWTGFDLSVRVDTIDEGGSVKAMGVGCDVGQTSMSFFVLEQEEQGYRSQQTPLWVGSTAYCPTLDVWPLAHS